MPKTPGGKKSGSGLMIASLVFAAALLPVMMMGILDPDGLRLISRADETKELRIWVEPANVVTKPGLKFGLNIVASYDNQTGLIPEVKAEIDHSEELKVNPENINFNDSFRGTVKLARVEVIAGTEGQFELVVDPESVFLSLPDVSVKSAKAVIISKK